MMGNSFPIAPSTESQVVYSDVHKDLLPTSDESGEAPKGEGKIYIPIHTYKGEQYIWMNDLVISERTNDGKLFRPKMEYNIKSKYSNHYIVLTNREEMLEAFGEEYMPPQGNRALLVDLLSATQLSYMFEIQDLIAFRAPQHIPAQGETQEPPTRTEEEDDDDKQKAPVVSTSLFGYDDRSPNLPAKIDFDVIEQVVPFTDDNDPEKIEEDLRALADISKTIGDRIRNFKDQYTGALDTIESAMVDVLHAIEFNEEGEEVEAKLYQQLRNLRKERRKWKDYGGMLYEFKVQDMKAIEKETKELRITLGRMDTQKRQLGNRFYRPKVMSNLEPVLPTNRDINQGGNV